MNTVLIRAIPFFTIALLSACTLHSNKIDTIGDNGSLTQSVATGNGAPVGGNLTNSMDQNDKFKLSRALDSAPGKPTHWVNMSTGMSYTVLPTKKISVNGNPFCRQYNLTASHGSNSQQIQGSACVGADGDWKSI